MEAKKLKTPLLLSLLVVFLDQVTKFLVIKLLPYGKPVKVVGNLLRLTFVKNPNLLFGLSFGEKFPYEVLSFFLILILIFLLVREERRIYTIFYGITIGGAFGNFLDRLRIHEVVDFIDIGVGDNLRWPVFNIADSAVTISLTMILFFQLRENILRRKR